MPSNTNLATLQDQEGEQSTAGIISVFSSAMGLLRFDLFIRECLILTSLLAQEVQGQRRAHHPALLPTFPLCQHVDVQHDRAGQRGELLHAQMGLAAEAEACQSGSVGREAGAGACC